MDNEGINGKSSFNPSTAFNERFINYEGKDSNNCATLALNKAMTICSDLINNKQINKNDKYILSGLKIALSLIIDQLVKENIEKGNSLGCQGRLYKKANELK